MAAQPTPTEQRAYGQMQARMVALLLRFSEEEYRKFFTDHQNFMREETTAALQVYRDLAVLFFLRTALFEEILPRIVRRLSFVSPHHLVVEEPPGRGRIDWERTLEASWHERPGEPPLTVHARQRLRTFATPTNLLTVATLLEYGSAVRRLLLSDTVALGAESLRHPLTVIVERCERALAFPQFAGIRTAAQAYLDGAHGGVEALEARVAAGGQPGGSSAYDDLLAWRRRYRALDLLRRRPADAPADLLGADPRRDNRLYQLWILFEVADLLIRRGLLDAGTHLPAVLRFRWGEGETMRHYELRHDQGIREQPTVWRSEPADARVPGVRPDYHLRRCDPPMTEVYASNQMIWREPGVIWDAKYYRERDRNHAPSGPVKRMLADLALTGETRGSLLFAFLRADESDDAALPDGVPALVQRLQPARAAAPSLDPRLRVDVIALGPDLPSAEIQRALVQLLDHAHADLREPVVPVCQGVFLDSVSVTEQGALSDRWGTPLHGRPDDLLVCPKPHLGPWRVDLVSRAMHCCQDERLCHIVGQAEARTPIRPPRDIESLLRELEHILGEGTADDPSEERVSAIAERVQHLTRRFADLAQVDLAFYHERVRGLGMRTTFDLLSATEQESLALAIFLTDQLFKVRATDYSAPAIHLSSVIEIVIKRRIFACPGLEGAITNPKKQTLGRLPYLKRTDDTTGNWTRINTYVAAHWNNRPNPNDPERVISFDALIDHTLTRITQIRNTAAHSEPLPRRLYDELHDIVFQGGRLGFGALNVLVLAWT